MPVYSLYFRAELENISVIKFPYNRIWIIDFQSAFSDEKRPGVLVTSSEEVEMPNTRAVANLCLSFKDTGKTAASVSVTTVKGFTQNKYLADDSGLFIPVAAFECRGAIPVKCTSHGLFTADNFRNIDLSNEWYDVDPDTCESVSITDVEWKFERQPTI